MTLYQYKAVEKSAQRFLLDSPIAAQMAGKEDADGPTTPRQLIDYTGHTIALWCMLPYELPTCVEVLVRFATYFVTSTYVLKVLERWKSREDRTYVV